MEIQPRTVRGARLHGAPPWRAWRTAAQERPQSPASAEVFNEPRFD